MTDLGAANRRALAQKGHALPDGSFPIAQAADVRKAVHALPLADSGKQARAKKHILKRARQLGAMRHIPSDWVAGS